MTGKCMGALAALVLLIAPWVWAASSEDVANLIESMPLSASAKATVNAGFLRGIADGRLTADQALAFLQRIATSGASIEDRQTVLVSIGQTLLEDIPVEMLINKVDEGLARGLPMDVIAAEVVERRQTLVEVKALLNLTGIQIQQQTNEPGFPRSAVDAAVTDIANTPGMKIKMVDHAEYVAAMNKKYGQLYTQDVIPKTTYRGMDADNHNATVWNILVSNENLSDKVAYDVVKTMIEKRDDLIAVHKEAANFVLANQKASASPIPFHAGAVKYFAEKGQKVN